MQHQDAANIEKGTSVCAEGTLKGTQRACAGGAGAGIAVDAGDTELLALALVDSAGNEALQVGVEQQREVQLHQPPFGGNKVSDLFHGFYPSPMHSVQIFTALASTSAVPPVKKPQSASTIPAASSRYVAF